MFKLLALRQDRYIDNVKSNRTSKNMLINKNFIWKAHPNARFTYDEHINMSAIFDRQYLQCI